MGVPSNPRNGATGLGKACSRSEVESEGVTDLQLRWREALVMWLRWNQAYEHVTERMFQAGHNPAQLQELMDQMDDLRREAVAQSQQLLD